MNSKGKYQTVLLLSFEQGGHSTMSQQMTIDYPSQLPDALQETPQQFADEARRAMAIKLFELSTFNFQLSTFNFQLSTLNPLIFLLRNKDR